MTRRMAGLVLFLVPFILLLSGVALAQGKATTDNDQSTLVSTIALGVTSALGVSGAVGVAVLQGKTKQQELTAKNARIIVKDELSAFDTALSALTRFGTSFQKLATAILIHSVELPPLNDEFYEHGLELLTATEATSQVNIADQAQNLRKLATQVLSEINELSRRDPVPLSRTGLDSPTAERIKETETLLDGLFRQIAEARREAATALAPAQGST